MSLISKLQTKFPSYRKWNKINQTLHSRGVRNLIAIVILIDLASIIFSSYTSFVGYYYFFHAVTFFSAFFFTLEYIYRIISAPAIYPQLSPWKARLKYILSFFGVIDFISILPFAMTYFGGSFYREIFELARIFLIFKLIRNSTSFHLIAEVFNTIRKELLTAIVCISFILCCSAILMYYIERDAQPEVFDNVGQGLWWSIITFTTVGYGDIAPITPLGKILGGIIAFFGIIMVALPTGIVSSTFISVVRLHKGKNNKTIEVFEIEEPDSFTCPHCGEKISIGKKK